MYVIDKICKIAGQHQQYIHKEHLEVLLRGISTQFDVAEEASRIGAAASVVMQPRPILQLSSAGFSNLMYSIPSVFEMYRNIVDFPLSERQVIIMEVNDTLAHELCHVRQALNGDLIVHKNTDHLWVEYKGGSFAGYYPYSRRPWEVEAYFEGARYGAFIAGIPDKYVNGLVAARLKSLG